MRKKIKQHNRSFFFLVPLLGISVTYFDAELFLNSYIRFPEKPDFKQHLFLVFNAEKLEQDKMAAFKLKNVLSYRESIFVNGFEILVHEIPVQFLDDYNIFKAGKYSQLSDTAKKKIIGPFFVKAINGETTFNYAALYPNDPESKKHKQVLQDFLGTTLPEDAEILSAPDLGLEEFKLSDFYDLFSKEADEDKNLTVH